jgi:hypothetical protein
MDNGSWFIVHGNLLFMGYLFCADQICYYRIVMTSYLAMTIFKKYFLSS